MNEDLIKYIGKTFGNLTVFGVDLDHKGYVYCQSTGKEKTITRVSIRKLLNKTNYPRTQKQKESAIRASRSRDMKIVAIKQESGSWKWAIFAATYTTALAWIVSFLVYQIGKLFM